MSLRTRRRLYREVPSGTGSYDRWLNGSYWYGSTKSFRSFADRQITQDEVHRWPREKGETRDDLGGPFHSVRSSLRATWPLKTDFAIGSSGSERYYGPVRPQLTPSDWSYLYPETADATFLFWANDHPVGYLEGLGAKAISATIPTNPHADVAVGVAELMREGFPTLIGTQLFRDRVASFRSLGKEYLNLEFGWKPFVGTILEAAQSIVDSDDLLQQLARDSGRYVRRGFVFPIERSTTYQEDNLFPDAPLSVGLYGQRGRSVTTLTYHRTWFAGCYTYHYDPHELTEASRIATQARFLLGLKIDPEVLWNLAPWSWLVDWFVNVGPVMHNLSAFGQDGLVLRYGYLMHHHTRRIESTHRGVTLPKGGDFPTGNQTSTFRLESKRRIRATPYGFGLTFASFSARQLAILAALGITRAPGAA